MENYTAITPAEVVKGQTYFYEFDETMQTVIVIGLRKGDKVTIQFTSGSLGAKNYQMTCKIDQRLFKKA